MPGFHYKSEIIRTLNLSTYAEIFDENFFGALLSEVASPMT